MSVRGMCVYVCGRLFYQSAWVWFGPFLSGTIHWYFLLCALMTAYLPDSSLLIARNIIPSELNNSWALVNDSSTSEDKSMCPTVAG